VRRCILIVTMFWQVVITFLRHTGNMHAIVASFKAKGLHGLADAISAVHLPLFAHWRWATLAKCCAGLEPIFESLATHFDATPFRRCRDQPTLSKVCVALGSSAFAMHLRFATWLTGGLNEILEWIGGCLCHEDELRQRIDIKCFFRGRRVTEAYDYAKRKLTVMLDTCNGWLGEMFDGDASFLQEAQGCVRGLYRLGLTKIDFLRRIPWLLAKLEEAGVKDEVLRQYRTGDPAHHHRVSHEFLHPDSHWLNHIEAICDDGSGVSPDLAVELSTLKNMPMDDIHGERPHSIAHRLMQHTRAAKFPWVAATARQEDNFSDVDVLLTSVDGDLNTGWHRWKSVVRVNERRCGKSLRLKRKEVENRVYKMSHCDGEACGIQDGPECDDDDDGEDGGGGGAPQDVSGDATRASGGSTGREAATSGGGVVALADSGVVQLALAASRSSTRVKLLREYLEASLQVHQYISIGDPFGGDAHVFQILGLEVRNVLVQTFVTKGLCEQLFKITVQPFERWKNWNGAESGELDCFIIEEPREADLISLSGCEDAARSAFKVWSVSSSDVDGCVGLHSPRPLEVRVNLSSPNVPTLCILDSLHASGFTPTEGLVTHETCNAPLRYDARKLDSKKEYLRCLMCLELLFNAGAQPFNSIQLKVFYLFLMKRPSEALQGLKGKDYEVRIALADGHPQSFVAMLDRTPGCAPTLAVTMGPRLTDDVTLLSLIDASDGVAGDDGADDVDAEAEAVAPAPSDIPVVAPRSPVVGDVLEWPPANIMGCVVKVESHYLPCGQIRDSGIRIQCPNVDHCGHSKYRSLTMDTQRFGPRAAEYFLGAWALSAFACSLDAHRKPPSREAIQLYRDTYGD
jgi:hypothetical protein